MCGVVSIIYNKSNHDLGNTAVDLLKKLEYRGYDSTGAAFFDNKKINVFKKVGAPSIVTKELGLSSIKGKRFIGQVRWATYDSVTNENSQPHKVNCFKYNLVGAHNGNISNTDSLKEFLKKNLDFIP